MARFELLTVLLTLCILRGWPEGRAIVAAVSSDHAKTSARLHAPAANSARIWVVDGDHGLVVVHRPGVHRDIMAAPLHALHMTFECGWCDFRPSPSPSCTLGGKKKMVRGKGRRRVRATENEWSGAFAFFFRQPPLTPAVRHDLLRPAVRRPRRRHAHPHQPVVDRALSHL